MAEAHALQCTTTCPHNAIPTTLLCVEPDLLGILSNSLAARYRTSDTLNRGLEKIQAAHGNGLAPIFALSSVEVLHLFHGSLHFVVLQYGTLFGPQWLD